MIKLILALSIFGCSTFAGTTKTVDADIVRTSSTDNSLSLKTKNLTRLYVSASGDVSIGHLSPSASLDIAGSLKLRGFTSGTVGLKAPAVSGSTVYTLPSTDGSSAQLLSTNGAGIMSWVTGGGDFKADGTVPMTGALSASNGISSLPGYTFSGDTDTGFYHPVANAVAVSASSAEKMRINGTGVGIGTTAPSVALEVSGDISIANRNFLKLSELASNGSNYVALAASSAMGSNITYYLPSADGSSAQVLSTSGTGNLYWASNASGGTVTYAAVIQSCGGGTTWNSGNPTATGTWTISSLATGKCRLTFNGTFSSLYGCTLGKYDGAGSPATTDNSIFINSFSSSSIDIFNITAGSYTNGAVHVMCQGAP